VCVCTNTFVYYMLDEKRSVSLALLMTKESYTIYFIQDRISPIVSENQNYLKCQKLHIQILR